MRRAATVLLVVLVGVFMAFYGGYDVDAESGYGELDVPGFLVWFAPGVASSDVPVEADWVDITSYVAYLSTVTGRDDEFTQPSAGQLDLGLDNLDGTFDPDNTSGPYYGQLLPLAWFRVTSGAATGNLGVFYGQVSIEGFQVVASAFPDVVRVEVLDMVEQLANTEAPESVWAVEVEADAPIAWYRLGESSGAVATDSSGNGHHGTYEGGATFDSRTGLIEGSSDNAIDFDGVDNAVDLPAGAAADVGGPLTVEAWFSVDDGLTIAETMYLYQSALTSRERVSLYMTTAGHVGFSAQETGGTSYGLSTSSALNDGGTHHVLGTYDGSTEANLYVDGVHIGSNAGGPAQAPPPALRWAGIGVASVYVSGPTVADVFFDGIIDEVAVYDSELSAARALAHYEAGSAPWASELSGARVTHILDAIVLPVGQRTIATGASTLQSASLNADAWSLLLATATAEGGDVYIDHADGGKVRFRGRRDLWTETRSLTSQATFGDGGGSEVPYASLDVQDDRIYNRATMQRRDGAAVTVSDAASATQYQRRTFSETGLLYETDAESQYRAERIVAEKKDRHRRVRSITLEPLEDTDLAWDQVFAREIGDRITVKWRPLYGGTYSFDSWIIGIRHAFDAAVGRLRTTFSLSPVPYDTTGEPYWIAGVSTAGVTTRPGY